MLWFSPRRRGSAWAGPNGRRIQELEAAGRIAPQGRALVGAAKADGSWGWLDEVEALIAPDNRRRRDALPQPAAALAVDRLLAVAGGAGPPTTAEAGPDSVVHATRTWRAGQVVKAADLVRGRKGGAGPAAVLQATETADRTR